MPESSSSTLLVLMNVEAQSSNPGMINIRVGASSRRGTTVAIKATQEHLQRSKTAAASAPMEVVAPTRRTVEQPRPKLCFKRQSQLLGEALTGDLLLLIARRSNATDILQQGQETSQLSTSEFRWH